MHERIIVNKDDKQEHSNYMLLLVVVTPLKVQLFENKI